MAYTAIERKDSPTWCGLTSVDFAGKHVTDADAVAYAAKKFDVAEDQIILKRTGGCILVRPKVVGDELEFMTFEQYKQKIYGVPIATDPHYAAYARFGYGVWLIKNYPDEWRDGDTTALLVSLEEDYHWYRLETYLDVSLESDLALLEKYLLGRPIFNVCEDSDYAIYIWHEFCDKEFVLLVSDDGTLTPTILLRDDLAATDDVFGGFGE